MTWLFCMLLLWGLGGCADGGTPRLEVGIALPEAGPAPQSLAIFVRQGEASDARFGVAVESIERIKVDSDGQLNISVVTDETERGTGLLYVVACTAGLSCTCLDDDCSPEIKALGPSCSCGGLTSFGAASFDSRGDASISIVLRGMPAECDLDGDLFPRCADDPNSICCQIGEGLPREGFWDCQDRAEDLPSVCDAIACDPAQAHPFRPNEEAAAQAVGPRRIFRHRTWCGDGLNNDCRGEPDVICGDFDGDGVPFARGANGDCDDDDPERRPGAFEICGDGIDQDCNGFDLPCDVDMDGVSADVDCDDNDADRFPGNPERCGDGVDQDCNGRDIPCLSDDLDFDGFSCPADAVTDTRACSGRGEDCNDLDASVHPGAKEICGDGIDQDCTGADLPCEPGDRDGDGYPDTFVGGMDCDDTDSRTYPGAPERCGDGVDQDCDGFDLDCSRVVDRDGDRWPTPFDCNDEDPQINPDAGEACNAIDDNCDGIVDEGNPMRRSQGEQAVSVACGDACPRANQPCACQTGLRVCTRNGGSEVIWPPPCLGVAQGDFPEICNGIDDDCDGNGDQTLTQPCYEGPLGTEGVGVCRSGQANCNAATGSGIESYGTCLQQILPAPEMCNGLDDDCDGATDESFELGEPCRGVGECGAGVRECGPTGGLSVICSTDAVGSVNQARPEQCDNRDNDCDGETDENVRNACGDCGDVPREVCNGRDEDCDGQVDEGVRNACGDCGEAPNEVCNGRDDDCDGRTDEGQLNACGACGDVPDELCNTLDDDCDGRVDEGFDLGDVCAGEGECGLGVTQCSPDGDQSLMCSSDPGGQQDRSSRDICNGLDDDCDGQTDEGSLANVCPGLMVNRCAGVNGCRCGDQAACDSRANRCNGAGRCRCGRDDICDADERCVGDGAAGECEDAGD